MAREMLQTSMPTTLHEALLEYVASFRCGEQRLSSNEKGVRGSQRSTGALLEATPDTLADFLVLLEVSQGRLSEASAAGGTSDARFAIGQDSLPAGRTPHAKYLSSPVGGGGSSCDCRRDCPAAEAELAAGATSPATDRSSESAVIEADTRSPTINEGNPAEHG